VSAASNLQGGEADVRAVHAALCDPSLGECNPNSSFARAGYTSAADFVKDFNEFLKDHKNEDQLIFYFSGHGRKVQDEYCLQIGPDEDELHAFSEIRSKLKIKVGGARHPDYRCLLQRDGCQGQSGQQSRTRVSAAGNRRSHIVFRLPAQLRE
jgi:hypothetical protein